MTDRDAILTYWLTYRRDPAAFVQECVSIYDAAGENWIKFDLWPAQVATLATLAQSKKLVLLKARQLGISWLCLAHALWLIIFQAPATILLFSLREEEAKELLWRLRGMYARLPPWLQARAVTHSNATRWLLSNGSRALAFSTKAGRSYTGTLALVDEADFVPDLSQFLNAVKPTIDAGGQLFLVSTVDKKRPQSTFKNLFRAAALSGRRCPASAGEGSGGEPSAGESPAGDSSAGDYRAVFLPWQARPGRDESWRAAVQAEMFAQRGTHDDFYAEYPASAEEALAAEQLDRRLPWEWVKGCVGEEASGKTSFPEAGLPGSLPSLPGLTVWQAPVPARRYVIGADPAEGNPNSDESAACVLDGETWGQVAELAGKVEPSTFAAFIDQLGRWYNAADVMVERNNHGHLVIRELERLGNLRLLRGYDERPGWLSNVKGKPLLYGLAADAVRAGACTIRSSETAAQLASIEASTLRAPQGLHDDRADAFALAVAALAWRPATHPSTLIAAADPLLTYDRGGW